MAREIKFKLQNNLKHSLNILLKCLNSGRTIITSN